MRRRGFRQRWLSREYLQVFAPAAVLTIVGFVVASQFIKPAPPTRLVIATGRTDGAYYQFGLRYRELLAPQGITLEVRSTSGSVENIRLLEDPQAGVGVAFVQGGTAGPARSQELVSLGSLYFEPLWVFSRAARRHKEIRDLRGRRLAIGPEGSETRAVAELLLGANGITAGLATFLPLTGLDAVHAFQRGAADAVFFVASPQSVMVEEMIHSRGVALMNFPRADAYIRFHPFLTKLVLPEGALDVKANIPARETVLIAPAANLVVRRDLHPALAELLLMTAAKVHGGAGMFGRSSQFPSPHHLEFPLSEDARRYYESGPPFLARYLPFWAATLVDRTKVMLVPLLTLIFPLFKILPPAYRWRVRSKVYRWYRDVRGIDLALPEPRAAADLSSLLKELDRIENEVRRMLVPLAHSEADYNLRLHIEFVRSKVRAVQAASQPGDHELPQGADGSSSAAAGTELRRAGRQRSAELPTCETRAGGAAR